MVVGRYGFCGRRNTSKQNGKQSILIPFNKLPCNAQLTVTTCPDMVAHRNARIGACPGPDSYAAATCWPIPGCFWIPMSAPGSRTGCLHCLFRPGCSSSQYHGSSFQVRGRSRSKSQVCDRCVDRIVLPKKQQLAGRTAKGQGSSQKWKSGPDLMAFLVRIPGIQTTRRAHDSVPI